MLIEELKEAAKVMEAYANGKKIQCNYNRQDNEGWVDTNNPSFNWDKYAYRIKPEPKYRPFKTQEECWNEMLKHQPFGWIRNNDTQRLYNIRSIDCNNYGVVIDNFILYFDYAFNVYNFVDGSPFGVKEE